MLKLTKKQKIDGYQYAINQLQGDLFDLGYPSGGSAPYICILLRDYLFNINRESSYPTDISYYFPEFEKCRPIEKEKAVQGRDAWWPETDEFIIVRIAALEWCIEQVKNTK